MADAAVYSGATEIATAHGVSRQAVYGWMAKASWPVGKGEPLAKGVVDEYVKGFVAPNRKTALKRSEPPKPKAAAAPAEVATDAAGQVTLEDLIVRIQQATTTEQANVLKSQVAAWKGAIAIQREQGLVIDADRASSEMAVAYQQLQSTLMAMARQLAGVLEGRSSAEIESVIEGRVVEALCEVKASMEKAIGASHATQRESVVSGGRKSGGSRAADAQPVGDPVPDAEPTAEQPAGAMG